MSIEVVKMQKQDYIQDPRYAELKTSTKLRKPRESDMVEKEE